MVVAVVVPELGGQIGVLDEIGAAVDPFAGGLWSKNVHDTAVPVVEEGEFDLLAPIWVPLKEIAGKFPVCGEKRDVSLCLS